MPLNFSIACLLISLVSLHMAPIPKAKLNVLTFIKIKSGINVNNINKKNKFGCTDWLFCQMDNSGQVHFSDLLPLLFFVWRTVWWRNISLVLSFCQLLFCCCVIEIFLWDFHAFVLYIVLSLIFLNFLVAYTPAEGSKWWGNSCITDGRIICYTDGL